MLDDSGQVEDRTNVNQKIIKPTYKNKKEESAVG